MKPVVYLVGGQDCPTPKRLFEIINSYGRKWWPKFDLNVVSWRTPRKLVVNDFSPASNLVALPMKTSPVRAFVAALVSGFLAMVDPFMWFDKDGEGMNFASRRIGAFVKWTTRLLYMPIHSDESVFPHTVTRLALALPRSGRVVVLAHSTGGNIALRACWALWEAGFRDVEFSLITMGGYFGHFHHRSTVFMHDKHKRNGLVVPPPNVRWTHFWSKGDALIARHNRRLAALAGAKVLEANTGPIRAGMGSHRLESYMQDIRVAVTIGENVVWSRGVGQ